MRCVRACFFSLARSLLSLLLLNEHEVALAFFSRSCIRLKSQDANDVRLLNVADGS